MQKVCEWSPAPRHPPALCPVRGWVGQGWRLSAQPLCLGCCCSGGFLLACGLLPGPAVGPALDRAKARHACRQSPPVLAALRERRPGS